MSALGNALITSIAIATCSFASSAGMDAVLITGGQAPGFEAGAEIVGIAPYSWADGTPAAVVAMVRRDGDLPEDAATALYRIDGAVASLVYVPEPDEEGAIERIQSAWSIPGRDGEFGAIVSLRDDDPLMPANLHGHAVIDGSGATLLAVGFEGAGGLSHRPFGPMGKRAWTEDGGAQWWVGDLFTESLIAQRGDVAPGTDGDVFAFFGSPEFSVTAAGEVAAVVRGVVVAADVEQPTFAHETRGGIWRWQDGAVELVVLEDSRVRYVGRPVINTSGEVAVPARIDDGGTAQLSAILVGSGGQLTEAFIEGLQPGGSAFFPYTSTAQDPIVIDNRGQVHFRATLDGSPTSFNQLIISVDRFGFGGGIEVQEGSPAGSAGGALLFVRHIADWHVRADGGIIARVATTDMSGMRVDSRLIDTRQGVLIAEGEPVDLGDGDNAAIRSFAFGNAAAGNMGRLLPDREIDLFSVELVDGRQAIVTPMSLCPADLSGDGVVTLADFSLYMQLWSLGVEDLADVTTTGTASGVPDGVVDLSDFSYYLTLWSAGCP